MSTRRTPPPPPQRSPRKPSGARPPEEPAESSAKAELGSGLKAERNAPSPQPPSPQPPSPQPPSTEPPSSDGIFDDRTILRAPRSDELTRPPVAATPKTVVLGVTGSIAAYKAAVLARLLMKAGYRVIPVMTKSALEFIGAQTLSGLTGERTVVDMFDAARPGEVHVDLAREADCIVLCPATADLLARLAQGRADDLLSALCLCATKPIIVAPSMHPAMWNHPATRRNVGEIRVDNRVEFVGPVDGEVASGDRGVGRMEEPEVIARAVEARLTRRDLTRVRVTVTAGPTVEDLDPVRFISNRSTGKMGFALAARAAARGADVTLLAGPVTLSTPYGVRRVDVRSAIAMRSALWQQLGTNLGGADILVMTAAVSDYRPSEEHASKMKREGSPMSLQLVPNPDILAEIGSARTDGGPVLVGFAVETESDDRIVVSALNKLEAKRVDMVVANHAGDSFGREDNRATIVTRGATDALGVMSKLELADRILDCALHLHRQR